MPSVVRGDSWTDDFPADPDSFIPNGSVAEVSAMIDQVLYLPLLYGIAQGVIYPGSASVIPTVQNGGISADATLGPSTCDRAWYGQMASPMMPATWTTPASSGSTPSSVPPFLMVVQLALS
jgi:hypothetical protein